MSLDRERSKIKLFIERERKKILLDEWLDEELSNAGYAGVRVVSTPREVLGTRIIIYALRPGLVIGRRGAKIKELAKKIEEVFNYKDVNISVYEVEEPELNPRIMAWQIERQLLRGIRYRRVGFWALNVIMNAGAAGVEIVISGKLRTVRSAFEKFTAGTVLKSGDIAKKLVESAKRPVLTKHGIIGVKVSIMKMSLDEYLISRSMVKESEGGESSEESR